MYNLKMLTFFSVILLFVSMIIRAFGGGVVRGSLVVININVTGTSVSMKVWSGMTGPSLCRIWIFFVHSNPIPLGNKEEDT